jgi:Phosphoribosylglycinamide synthetase, ATP-grasp (A) domain
MRWTTRSPRSWRGYFRAHQLQARRFGDAGAAVVIEQRIVGREISILALTDGTRLEVLPAVEDHKAIFDGDRGRRRREAYASGRSGRETRPLRRRCPRSGQCWRAGVYQDTRDSDADAAKRQRRSDEGKLIAKSQSHRFLGCRSTYALRSRARRCRYERSTAHAADAGGGALRSASLSTGHRSTLRRQRSDQRCVGCRPSVPRALRSQATARDGWRGLRTSACRYAIVHGVR